jgi:hypothetical protein
LFQGDLLQQVVCLLSSSVPDSVGVSMSVMTLADWKDAQQQDPVISEVLDRMNGKSNGKIQNLDVKILLKTKGLVLHDGVLFRCRKLAHGEVKQLVLPEKWRKKAFEMLHNEMGHLGRD